MLVAILFLTVTHLFIKRKLVTKDKLTPLYFVTMCLYKHITCGYKNVNLPALTLGRNLRGPQLQKRRQKNKQDNEMQTTDWARKAG